MTDAINLNGIGGISFDFATNKGMPIQLQFAKMQAELAKTQKETALETIEDIKKSQQASKTIAETIIAARSLLSAAQNNNPNISTMRIPQTPEQWKAASEKLQSKNCTQAEEFFLTNIKKIYDASIDGEKLVDKVDDKNKLKEINSASDFQNFINALKSIQEQTGTDVQQQMVFVPDHIGQYNAYTQGSSAAIREANQTLNSMAKGQ